VDLPAGPLYVAVLRDIAARRALERGQRDFVAMVTHELKGPLTALKGYAQLMQRRATYSERGVAAILTQTAQIERLIDDLLDAARSDAGQLELRRARADLTAIARDCVEQAQAASASHRVRLDAPEERLVGVWDAGRVQQVLGNLLSNAIKYAPDGGDITVRLADLGDAAEVTVSDQGIGMGPDALARLFERFYRSGAARGSAQGLGLGLNIARALVEAHGGRIWATSELGVGSTFIFTLPYAPPAATPTDVD
jgi:signal transduction histidine kinase